MNNKYHDLATLTNSLYTKLRLLMTDTFGSYYPDKTSSHCMLHSIVAKVLESQDFKKISKFDSTDTVLLDAVLECMKRIKDTNGDYGNIYNPEVLSQVLCLVQDFIRLRNSCYNYTTGVINTDRSVEYKLRCELSECGMKINKDLQADNKYNVYFDESKILKSTYRKVLLKLCDVPNLKEICNLVIQRYNAMNNVNTHNTNTNMSNANTKIIDVIFDENFVVGADVNKNLDTYVNEWNNEQLDIIKHISLVDKIPLDKIKLIGGMDVSFSVIDPTKATACLIIHDYKDLNIVARFSISAKIHIPYKAGYLAFREAPILLKLLDEVKNNYPEAMPDLIILDGNGIYHPRFCGVASYFSVLSGIPCIGMSKSVLYVGNITRDSMKENLTKNAPNKGDYCKIIDNGKLLGFAYNVTGSITKAVYISPGSYVSMDSCMEIAKHMSKYRINESVRQADILSRMFV